MHEAPVPADLIERAFGLARQSGKLDWWAMTIPVLKNRLLLLTKNTFKEADFGATSFRDFLSKVPDIVRVDETPPPGFVILKSAAPERWERLSANKFRGQRIRADLWRAVLDYSSGRRYVWDISQQVARSGSLDEEGLVLPTISAVDLEEWRAEFVASHKPPDAEVAKLVEEWCRNRLPTAGLPAPMRPVWNNYLKRKVEQRLQHWFGSNSIKAPAIMEEGQGSGASDQQVEALREFIVGCVKIMSNKELLELRISPVTAMRMLRAKKSSDENER
jgi:hypothetical protein